MSTQERLRFAIIEYIQSIIKSKSLSDDATESLEVATQCLAEAFGLSPADQETGVRLSIAPLSLFAVFSTGMQVLTGPAPSTITTSETAASGLSRSAELSSASSAAVSGATPEDALMERFVETLRQRGFFAGLTEGSSGWNERLAKAQEKFRERHARPAPTAGTTMAASATTPAASGGGAAGAGEGAEDEGSRLRERLAQETHRMEEAEALKTQGNDALVAKKYHDAVALYTKAIDLCPGNAVYYSNRAAAFTHLQRNEEALEDCRRAVRLKPDFSKAYSRLGTAHFQAGRYQQAIDEGYRRAVELEPSNAQYKQALEMAETKLAEEQDDAARRAGATFAAGGGFGGPGGGGGGGGGGGMGRMEGMDLSGLLGGQLDVEGIMRDPAFLQMAQEAMSNPSLISSLMQSFGGAGGGGHPFFSGSAAAGAAGAAVGGFDTESGEAGSRWSDVPTHPGDGGGGRAAGGGGEGGESEGV